MHLHQVLVILTVVQSLLTGMVLLRHLDNKLKVVFGFVCFAVFIEISNVIFINVFGKTTLWMGHFYVMIEFIFWAVFYGYLLKPLFKQRWYWIVVVAFELYCILNTIFIQDLAEYPFTRSVEGIIIVLFSLLYFHKIMMDSNLENPLKEPTIWINSAVLVYFGGSVFHYLFFNVLLQLDMELLSNLNTYFFISLNVLFYLVISFSFYLQKLKSARN